MSFRWGPEETATRRLNFAQAFNPVGTNIGVLLAAVFILPKLDEPVNMANLTPAEEHTIRAGQLGAVMGPYLGLGFVLIAIGLVIAINKSPPIVEEFESGDLEGKSPLRICCRTSATCTESSLSSSTWRPRSAHGPS